MHDIDGVGMYIIILKAQLLTLQEVHYRNAREDVLYKCEFVALLTTTHTMAEAAISAYSSDARKIGLTVALPRQIFWLWVMECRKKSYCFVHQ